jgi:hypothetical protein
MAVQASKRQAILCGVTHKTKRQHADMNRGNSQFGKSLTLRNREGRRPLIPQNVEADRAVCVDVWVVDLGRKADLGRLERVVGWEAD